MGGRNLVHVRNIVVATIFDFMTVKDLGRVEIVTLTVGARAKEGKGRGGGDKKIRLPDIIVLLGNSVRWQTELLIGEAWGSRLMPVNFFLASRLFSRGFYVLTEQM